MRQFIKTVSAALVLGGTLVGVAQAEGEFSGNVALTSDYVFRGFTQTDGAPTIQGGFDYADDSGFYVGTWASGVDFSDGTSTEIDIYGGWTPTVGAFDLDIGAIYYIYPDAPDDPAQNFLEVYAGAGTTLGETVDVGGSIAYSPDYYYETGATIYYAAYAGVPLGESFGVDASVGFLSFLDDDDCMDCDYVDYSIGLTTEFEGFGFDFRFIGSDGDGVDGLDGDGGPAGERFVATISRSM
ncbi:MAG: TorF family putative porin [Hyphomonadaceae bacterium]|nr:TorF family putative porin [Hyphomonadaceae bacterium]